jgi:electron transfer flavoprotein alpha subunit
VEEAVRLLARRGALTPHAPRVAAPGPAPVSSDERGAPTGRSVAVVVEPGRTEVARELLAAGARLGAEAGAAVHALVPAGSAAPDELGGAGADLVVELGASTSAEDVAAALSAYVAARRPWAVLAPGTAFGREVAGRAAAATGSGLVGDAVELSCRDGVLVAAKPAFAGALLADITCRSETQMATVRPGVLPAAPARRRPVPVEATAAEVPTRGRVRLVAERRNDDVETLARADVVIGVGAGVVPDEYEQLSPLAAVLGAELAASRKVTDKGWAPRARQVGITGRSIAPRLYVAVGLSGKFNHMVGVRAAGTVLAVNEDRGAPVFEHCDVGIVGDWHQAVPLLAEALRRAVVS